MSTVGEIALMAYLAERVTESDQTRFEPDCKFPAPALISKKHPAVPSQTVLDLAGGIFHERVSARHFTEDIVPIEAALKILNSAYGFQKNGHRTVPSAGNYYPLTLHLCQLRGGEIGDVFIYDAESGRLDLTHKVALAIQDGLQVHHVDFSNASWFVLWSCRLIAPASKYGARAYRFICFEIGHSAQMAILECRSQGVECISLGGINEAWFRKHILRTGRRLLPQYGLLF